MKDNLDRLIGSSYQQLARNVPTNVKERVVKVGAYMRDLGEIHRRETVPPEYTRDGTPEKLRDLLMSPEQVSVLLQLTGQFPDNGIYRARQRVGLKEKGNIHPHDFVIERKGTDTFLYFVDPEQSLQSRIRPRAAYIETMHLSSNKPPEIALFRCRTPDLKNPQDIKADALLQEARKLITNRGIPEFMRGQHHGEITVRLVASEKEGIAQIRSNVTINEYTISELLNGNVQSWLLDSVIRGHQIRIQQFIKLLENQDASDHDRSRPKFEPLVGEQYK